jgi:hypothetical protein
LSTGKSAQSLFEGKRGVKPVAEYLEPERLSSEIDKLKRRTGQRDGHPLFAFGGFYAK